MIDKESQVYTTVMNAVQSLCTNTGTTFNSSPSSFPYLYLTQIDNSGGSYDLDGSENSVSPSIEIHIYTNGTSAKSKNKSVMKLADESMISMGFQRVYGPRQQDNLTDTQVTHYIARYTRNICSGDSL